MDDTSYLNQKKYGASNVVLRNLDWFGPLLMLLVPIAAVGHMIYDTIHYGSFVAAPVSTAFDIFMIICCLYFGYVWKDQERIRKKHHGRVD